MLLRAAADAYYGGAQLEMDDARYDQLVARVAATEAHHQQWKTTDSGNLMRVITRGDGRTGEDVTLPSAGPGAPQLHTVVLRRAETATPEQYDSCFPTTRATRP